MITTGTVKIQTFRFTLVEWFGGDLFTQKKCDRKRKGCSDQDHFYDSPVNK